MSPSSLKPTPSAPVLEAGAPPNHNPGVVMTAASVLMEGGGPLALEAVELSDYPVPVVPRTYLTELVALSAHIPHGEEGHLNIYVRDQDSSVTGFGAHNRLVVMGEPDGSFVSTREDFKWGLPRSTDEQRRKILNSEVYRQHPRGSHLEFMCSDEPYDNGRWTSVMHNYRVEK